MRWLRVRCRQFLHNPVYQPLEGRRIEFSVGLPMTLHVLQRHEIRDGFLQSLLKLGVESAVFQVGMDQRKLVQPQLQVTPLPFGIDVLCVSEDVEKLRMGESETEQLPVHVIDLIQGLLPARFCRVAQLQDDQQQAAERNRGRKHRDEMVQ